MGLRLAHSHLGFARARVRVLLARGPARFDLLARFARVRNRILLARARCVSLARSAGAPQLAGLVLALLGLIGLVPHARAEPDCKPDAQRGTLALHWVRLPGSEACIAGDALARVVETKLRRNVFPTPRDATILIEGYVAKTDNGFRAELRMTSAKGDPLGLRDLSSSDASCRELSETLGVVLAVMIDPDAAKRSPSDLPGEPEPEVKEEAAAEPARNNHTLAFGRVLLGITKKALVGFGAAYERALGRAGGLRIEAVTFLESDDTRPVDTLPKDAATHVRVAYVGVAYCPLWLTFSQARLAGCAGFEVGAVNAHDDGFPLPTGDQTGVWLSASASLRLAIVLHGPLEAHLAGSFLGAFGTPLVIRGPEGQLHSILPKNAPVGGVFDLGLGARF
jgi:hypothetical protein